MSKRSFLQHAANWYFYQRNRRFCKPVPVRLTGMGLAVAKAIIEPQWKRTKPFWSSVEIVIGLPKLACLGLLDFCPSMVPRNMASISVECHRRCSYRYGNRLRNGRSSYRRNLVIRGGAEVDSCK